MAEETSKDPYFDEFINIPLIRAGRKMQWVFHRDALAPHGLSIQEWRALLFIEQLGGSHLREIARHGRLDPTHMSRAVASLERRGLVTGSEDPKDQRRKRLASTPEGAALVAKIWVEARALDQKIRDALGKTRYGALRDALVMILELADLEPDTATGAYAAE